MVEYKVIVLKVKDMEETFNRLAKEGWKLITSSPNMAMGYGVVCTLEREVK